MSKKKILIYGEHPFTFSGNGNMLFGLLGQFQGKQDEYDITCFVVGECDPMMYDIFVHSPVNFIPARNGDDVWGLAMLTRALEVHQVDYFITVGVDLWRFHKYFEPLVNAFKKNGTKWLAMMPYDSPHIVNDWVKWINVVDVPLIYSEFGYQMVKEQCPHARYFRPAFFLPEVFKKLKLEEYQPLYESHFKHVDKKNSFIFGFIGNNQLRKEPQKVMEAFSRVRKHFLKKGVNAQLYMHTTMISNEASRYNLMQIGNFCNLDANCVTVKTQNQKYSIADMVKLYNSLDCLVLPSLQEGLSWTVIESNLCGTPALVSDSTAHKEIVDDELRVPCNETAMLPIMTTFGHSHIPCPAVSVDDLFKKMVFLVDMKINRPKSYAALSDKCMKRSRDWVNGSHNIIDVLSELENQAEIKIQSKNDTDILFTQHSSAGDILMTTQVFKGLKEKHPDMRLVYMTQKIYMDILVGNPYVDEIIEWDASAIENYEVVYSPHKDRILHGGWNNLDVTLYSLYPYFCGVEADKMFIEQKKPKIDLPDEYIVVHTTGGQPYYRTYNLMHMAINNIELPVIQIGGSADSLCSGAIDHRGLSFRENAWVMGHAKAAIVVDSFPSHLAGAVGTPAVVLYGPAPARVTQPRPQGTGTIINIEPDKLRVCPITGSCWGQTGKKPCESPCINTIHPITVKQQLNKLLEESK